MEDDFVIPVTYKNEEYEFASRLLLSGYLHKIEVDVNGVSVMFEPDEERSYRALVTPEQLEKTGHRLDVGLLQAVAYTLGDLLKNP